jgi:hypothetical protein
MLGAILMHFKVNDDFIKFIPASIMLFSSLLIIYISSLDKYLK